MKKFLFGMICLLCATNISAQFVRWGVRAGAGVSNFSTSEKVKWRFAYKAGADVYLDIFDSDFWLFSPGIYYSRKGFNWNGAYGPESIKDNVLKAKLGTYMDYIEVPFLVLYNIELFDDSDYRNISLKFGPYVAYGISSKTQMEVPEFNKFKGTFKTNHFDKECTYDEAVYFNSGTPVTLPKMNRFDVGLQVGIDLRFNNHYIIGADFQYGLLNTVNKSFLGKHPKNMQATLSLSYEF
ncbi:porin family protein [Phocaeicola oris]|uniref:porin family protein n=1 Tax=Phocaeicola oris TaxID=2896850 RepID=UPI00234F90A8|nr:porin family protein [Phocaeicola oris]MCE2616034.1 PorT family protein [Phocaeicola oris]